jgi:hypothetical protein
LAALVGRSLLAGLMGPVPVVMAGVLAEDRVGAENTVTSCDLGIFMDQAAEPVPT